MLKPHVIATAWTVASATMVLTACGTGSGGGSAPAAVSTTSTSFEVPDGVSSTALPPPPPTPAPTAPTPTSRRPTPSPPATPPPGPVVVAYRVEVRTSDSATGDFPGVVESTLSDTRGWSRAQFVLERRDDAEYLVVIAEGDEVDRLCLPYDTYGKYSCQNGPVVAINADRWRYATPKWTGDLATYKQMLVNHEVGHLLGQHHPKVQCPKRGEPAPIMAQQSTELDGCLPNPWPLSHEIEKAARHDEPLAPPYNR